MDARPCLDGNAEPLAIAANGKALMPQVCLKNLRKCCVLIRYSKDIYMSGEISYAGGCFRLTFL